VDLGSTVLVVEHNLDVIKTADWVIDLGPEAGDAGGRVVAAGTPEEVARVEGSHTGAILAEVVAAGAARARRRGGAEGGGQGAGGEGAETVRAEDIALEAGGKDARMPGQTDGRRWHTKDRLTAEGKPARWEGAILDWLDARVHELGEFGATDWGERALVEIAA